MATTTSRTQVSSSTPTTVSFTRMQIRKFITSCEDTLIEAGRPTGRVVRKAVSSAVIVNPYAGQFVEDLSLLERWGADISGQLAERALGALGCPQAM